MANVTTETPPPRMVPCPDCGGDGIADDGPTQEEYTCRRCEGEGEVYDPDYEPCCHCCGGIGMVFWGSLIRSEPCPECRPWLCASREV
jgi:DnaJ-class molecular chaperone